jgi:hypothetical protein
MVYQLEALDPHRVTLMAVSAMGIHVVFTSCLPVATLDMFAPSPDNTHDVANVMWISIEPNVKAICETLLIL